jgi:outer membrane protein assembly factor BamB
MSMFPFPKSSFAIACGAFLFSLSFPARADDAAANWPRWRGPHDNGSTASGSYPVSWRPDNIRWKVRLPGKGCSTPIVWNQRIYVTAPTNEQDAVLAFDREGKALWHRTLGPENPGKHRNGSGSNPSPATDGSRLYVNFKSGALAALEFDGKVRWQINLVSRYGPDTLYWDHGTSPVLTDKNVVMARMHQGDSWLAAFDKLTGRLVWKVPRNFETPQEGDHGYTTPLVVKHLGKEALLVWGAEHLTLHDAHNGKTLWTCGGFNPESKALWPAVATPVIAGNMVVVATGRNDRNQPRLHGIRLGGQGDVTKTHRVWKREDIGTFVPSLAEYQGRVYLVRDRGQVECIDPTTGASIWTATLPTASASYYSSPLIANGRLYAAREDGVVFVASIQDQFELLSENKMGEPIIASPVPAGDRLFLRGYEHLFCITATP